MANDSKTDLLRTQKHEMQKTRYFYDVSGRPSYVVQAAVDTADGGPALVTKFGYADATATSVQSSREYKGEWSSAWDLTETTPS